MESDGSHFYRDQIRRRSADSGEHCRDCGEALPLSITQWGGALCATCKRPARPKRALHAAVALEDVNDVHSYVERVVMRRFPRIDNQDEYIAEGVALTYRLHAQNWKRDLCPSFRTYLSTLLPQRLMDFYRVEMRQSGRGCRGQSEFEYREVDSLDVLREIGMEPAAPDVGGLAA